MLTIKKKEPWKKCFRFGVASALGLFSMAVAFSCGNPVGEPIYIREKQWIEEETTSESQRELFTVADYTAPSPVVGADGEIFVDLEREDGTVESLSLSAYLWGVVAAEMPASFPLEALKAQTVAARTYTMLRLENPSGKHVTGQLCDDSGCCQAYIDVEERLASWGEDGELYREKLSTAVAETEGLCVLYEGKVIDAVFFSSVDGNTVEALEVWGSATPYLQSVPSPEGEEVPNYNSEVMFTEEELRQILVEYAPSIHLPEDPTLWFSEPLHQSGGAVAELTVGNLSLSGTQARSLFGLRSTSFSVDYEVGLFRFSVTGYGHGVGMSQYGAKTMAEQGRNFAEILQWYYSGTLVEGYLA